VRAAIALAVLVAAPLCLAGVVSPEATAPTDAVALDLSQVNFRLLRVVSDEELRLDPDAHEILAATPLGGDIVSLPVDPQPIMTITDIESAVIHRDVYHLHHLDLHMTNADHEAFAAVTADNPGRRMLWVSGDTILADITILGRDTSGIIRLFFGDTPYERIESVVSLLQIPHTLEVAEDIFTPETEADEILLEALQALQLHRDDQVIPLLTRCLEAGGEDFERRPQVLMVLGDVHLRQGRLPEAKLCFQAIHQNHPDFPDLLLALRGLRDIAALQGDPEEAIAIDRVIVRDAERDSDMAMGAQTDLVERLRALRPDAEVTTTEIQRLINMLQTRLATMGREESFLLEARMINYQLLLGQSDAAMRVVQARLANLPEDANGATLQVLLIASLLSQNALVEETIEILGDFAEQFEAERDLEDPVNQQLLKQIQTVTQELSDAYARAIAGSAASPEAE
jgi:tetratricopeptide (TPR) repeat protein